MITLCLNVLLHKETRRAERSLSLPALTRTNSWTSPLAMLRLGSTNNLTGLLRDILTRESTESVIVAEKSIVWREVGHDLMISDSSSAKPSSSILSASSRTKISTASKLKDGELRI